MSLKKPSPAGGRLAVHFRTGNPLWETPWPFFRGLDREFHFDLDVCAVAANAKCARFYSPAEDGLCQPWAGACWMNPPYGREIGRWVAKALTESRRGCLVVSLLPARTDTAWWHEYVMPAAEIRLVRGRLKFGGSEHSAPFPSAVVVYRPGIEGGPPRLSTINSGTRSAIPDPSRN